VQARDAIYRFWALKVPPDHGIVTKTQRGVLRILSQLEPPSKWWTPMISSWWSRKVFHGYGTASIYG
jgi:hypothetical protein